MKELTQNEAIEKVLTNTVSKETASELVNLDDKGLSDTFDALYEQMSYKGLLPTEPTVKSLLQGLYELTSLELLETYFLKDYQHEIFNHVEQLSELLGIELEEV